MIKTVADIQALPFTISPSVSELRLHAAESEPCWIEFVAWYDDEKNYFKPWHKSEKKYEVVRFKLERMIGVRMCGMGGEAGATGIGVVEKSRWLKEINALQLETYPNHPDNFKDVRHYYIRGHDEAVEFLCEGFTWETVKELPNW